METADSKKRRIIRQPKPNSALSALDIENIRLGKTLYIIVSNFNQLKCYRQMIAYVRKTSNKDYKSTCKRVHNEDKDILLITRIA